MRAAPSTGDAPDHEHRPLLITVSFNASGYEATPYFASRSEWARTHGVEHLYVSESTTGLTLDAHCSAWLRLPLMQALRGRPLFYLDNDCIVDPACPSFDRVTGGLDELFIARGHSGRPNSGVLMVSARGSEIFDFCVDRIHLPPPPACEAPYENGHVIWATTQLPWRALPPSMNNTGSEQGHVVHHTGPNRGLRQIEPSPEPAAGFDFTRPEVGTPAALRDMASAVMARLRLEASAA